MLLAATAGGVLTLAALRASSGGGRIVTFWLGWFVLAQLPTANLLVQESTFDERYVLVG